MTRFDKAFAFVFSIVFFSGVFVMPAYAQKYKTLDEQAVTRFIEKTTKIITGSADSVSPDQAIRYLERHLHDDARFKSVMTYQIPGFPTQESAMRVDKREFIESIDEGAQALTKYQTEVQIKDVQISSDKRKATVQTVNREIGAMAISNGFGEPEEVPITGTSQCSQILMLNKKGDIQMYNANCETLIEFSGF